MPVPGVTREASPARSTPGAGSPPTPPTERTAYKLAKQLRTFQGCTHEEHAEADRLHQEHHQRSDVCAVPAAGIVAEAMVALVVADAVVEKFGGDSVQETRRNVESYLETLRYR